LEPTHATACNIGNCNIKRRWEDISDEDWETLETNCPTGAVGEVLETLETICPTGAVMYFLDARITAKDISWPTVLCLTDLSAPESVQVAETVICEPLALSDHEAIISRRLSDLEELNERLAKLHNEFKKDMAKDIAGIGDRITAALIEKFSINDAGNDCKRVSSQSGDGEEQGQVLSQSGAEEHYGEDADAYNAFSVGEGVVAAPVQRVLSQSGDGEEQGQVLSQSGAEEEDMLHKGATHRDTSAIDSDYFVLVHSEQYKMKRYWFKRSQFNRDLQEVMYSNQLCMKRYSFKNSEACRNKMHEQVLSDLMKDESMYPTPEEADMLNLLCHLHDLDWQDKTPRVLSQSGARDEDCKLSFSFASV